MEPQVGEPQVYVSPTPFYKSRWFLGLIILSLIPVTAALAVKYWPLPPKPAPSTLQTQTQEKTIKESESPIAFEILKNPVVYQWRGSVSGTLVAKDKNSITISKDGASLKIPLDSLNKNAFFNKEGAGQVPPKFLTLDEISIGSKLIGDFFVSTGDRKVIIGSSFMVIEE